MLASEFDPKKSTCHVKGIQPFTETCPSKILILCFERQSCFCQNTNWLSLRRAILCITASCKHKMQLKRIAAKLWLSEGNRQTSGSTIVTR